MEHIDNSDNRRFQKRVRGSPKQKRDFSRYLVQKRESTSQRLLSELSMYFMELWTCSCLDFPGSTTILDDFLKVSKKELLLPEFDLMVSNMYNISFQN
jgi:hypothetical protein